MSPTLVCTVTDILRLSETAPSHDGQPVVLESGGWLQNTTSKRGLVEHLPGQAANCKGGFGLAGVSAGQIGWDSWQ